MRPVAPRTGAPEVTVAEEQEQYMPVTVSVYQYETGERVLLTRWTLTPDERKRIAEGEDVYVGQVNFGTPMTPLIVQCGPDGFVVEETEPA